MTLISHSLPALTGGVSQQPDNLKFGSQLKTLENAWPSLDKGLQKRPPSENHGTMFSGALWPTTDKPAFHWIDRSVDERYLVGVSKNETTGRRLKVWDVLDTTSGAVNEKVVQATRSAYDYLDSANPEDYRFHTIADVTYIVNRTKQPAMTARKSEKPNKQSLIYVRSSLSSGADEKVVVTFNGAKTAYINDSGASSQTLAANIYAAITGTDASPADVTFNEDTNRISLPSGSHGLANNMAVRFTLSSGTDWPKYRRYEERYSVINDDYYWDWVEYDINENTILYLREVSATTGGTARLCHNPGWAAINIAHNGANVQLVEIGEGSVPTGFEKCVVQAMPPAASSSDNMSGNVLLISHEDGEDFELTVSDGAGGTLVDVYHDSSPTFSELPDTAVDGFLLQVKNDPATALDDYWVKFISDEGPGVVSKGYWEETRAADNYYEIDPKNMPHILVRRADGHFDLCEAGRMQADIYAVNSTDDRITIRSPLDTSPGSPSSATTVHFFKSKDEVWVDVPANGLEADIQAYTPYYVKPISNALGSETIELYYDADLTDKVAITASAGSASYGYLSKDPLYPNYVWEDRTCGDGNTNPSPTFLKEPIKDVTLFKNRLTFVAGENAILSEGGQYGNFWRTTMTQLLDTDAIDIASSWEGISSLETATPYQDILYIAGRRVQFALGAAQGQAFTSKTADLRVSTTLSVNNGVAPVMMDTEMYIPFSRGDYTGVYEYTPDPNVGGRFTDVDVTMHIPQYITGEVRSMAALEREGVVAVLGTNSGATGYSSTNSIYVFKTYKRNEQRVQSAWAKYTFNDADIRSLFFYDHELYMVMRKTSGWCINKIGFKSGRVDDGSTYLTHLDRRTSYTVLSGDYNGTTNQTTLGTASGSLYSFEASDPMEVISTAGERVPVHSLDATNNRIILTGDHRDKVFWVGEKYTMTAELPHQYLREDTKSGEKSIVHGRLQIRRGVLSYADSTYFKVSVTPLNRTSYEYEFTGQVLGGGVSAVGKLPLVSGEFEFPINSKNDEVDVVITNDSPMPSNLTGCGFESNFHMRSRRM
ncbi:MAG: hypothetical protein CL608_34270 [Anaerolineaceae bacterium]|nr:hypothetical protein [Anaerolineaceae bacterium]